jgi:hypothetical protein
MKLQYHRGVVGTGRRITFRRLHFALAVVTLYVLMMAALLAGAVVVQGMHAHDLDCQAVGPGELYCQVMP